jgi:zinc transporter, ZIP family
MWEVIALSLLPVVGNLAGAGVAELSPNADRWRNWALHGAVGVVFAVVAVEIMPEALDVLAGWEIALAFLVGGATYLVVEWITDRRSSGSNRMWMIYVAVATDLFGDGLLIGAGSAVAAGLGLVLAVGQVLADVPEGAASNFTFRANDVDRRRRLLLSVSFVIPAVVGATLSYALLRDQSASVQLAALVATAGLFSVAAFEDMIAEAHDAAQDTRTSTAALLAGFALFVVVSAGLD